MRPAFSEVPRLSRGGPDEDQVDRGIAADTCAKISAELGLEQFLVIGKGMGSHAQTPPSVLADVFESLIGAIYLDGGMEAAQAVYRSPHRARDRRRRRGPGRLELQEQSPASRPARVW